nr:unnamed protein product [Digitaria exilis]
MELSRDRMLLGCEGSGAARRATYRPTVSAPGSWNREKRDKRDGGKREGERGGEPHYTAADHERRGTRRRLAHTNQAHMRRGTPDTNCSLASLLAHMVSAYLANGDWRTEEERNNENVWRTGTYIHLGTLLMNCSRDQITALPAGAPGCIVACLVWIHWDKLMRRMVFT